MAFDYMDYAQDISYIGFDKNPYWEKVHNEIEARYATGKVQLFRDVNVLDFFKAGSIPNCNVLSIEYLISFFFNSLGQYGVKQWFEQLVNQVIKFKPKDSPLLVIINDVDSIYTGRDTLLLLGSIVERSGLTVSYERRMRFKDTPYYPNSRQYHSKQNKFDIPQFVIDNYCPAIRCESAQLILEVN